MGPRALAALLAPTITLLALVGRSDAGIVIYEDGGSVVGKFGPEDVTAEEIFLRSVEGQQGSTMKIDRRRVRWYDPVADAPTKAYFEEHLHDPLEARWDALRDKFIRGLEVLDPGLPDPGIVDVDPLGQRVALAHGATVRPLRGYAAEPIVDEVTMYVAARPAPSGYAPRIHVFSSERPSAEPTEQLGWIDGQLRSLAVAGGYHMQELYKLRPVPGGVDQVMITTTRAKDGRELRALRRICFRGERTWFFTAYADADDFEALRERFRLSLESFTPGP
jgi:hypothetical protein